jgi:DNA-binding IclR family transcriptional regulator
VSGLNRYISLLRLYTQSRTEMSVPEMAAVLDAPASTVYRTVHELVAHDLLYATTESRYRLGHFFVEFDRLVRITDPLFVQGTELLRDVVAQARVPCAAVLARLYGDTVMCVADYQSSESAVSTSYERGRPRPLLKGATSKVILAQLPTRRLGKLLQNVTGPFQKTEAELREELTLIRKRGYAVTRGEVDKGLVGIAAAIALPDRALLGSLSLVVSAATFDESTERRLVLLVVSSALLQEEIKRRMLPEKDSQAVS